MPTRNVNLTDELEGFVLAKVKSGRYEKRARWSARRCAFWRTRNENTRRSWRY